MNGTEAPTSLHPEMISRQFVDLIQRDFARHHLLVSQGRVQDSTTERLVICESTNPAAIFNVGVRMGVDVDCVVADGEAIARLIDDAYGQASNESPSLVGGGLSCDTNGVDELIALADRDLLCVQGKAPVIQLIDALLFEALRKAASDVHVQPLADRTLVRYRLDGVLHTARELSTSVTNAVISRIKVMGRMDIAERRIPQDGRASVAIGERAIDLRISTLPTSYGERAVIRLLDNSKHLCDFQNLGMPAGVSGAYLECAGRANGMILLTGPTGSGKTTTLYSTLRRIGSDAMNIMTIEDPIEYELSMPAVAISQSQVNPKKGITFATGLRHILRQDPDVIMVGEVRDAETARIAIQSSLTGHMVFSTLHTNDAASAITRLVDLDIEPYLVSASLSGVLAQRLVRVFHRECNGRGCSACLSTGFRGRAGLFELLVVDERICELISVNAPLSEIRQSSRVAGMKTLREEGERLAAMGMTSLVEVHRVVQGAI